jgi:universal stress protein A
MRHTLSAMKLQAKPRSGAAAKNIKIEPVHDGIAVKPLKIARILVPVDFSVHSIKALETALSLAGTFGAEITLVHIVEQIIYPGDWMYPPIAMTDFAAEQREQISAKLKALAKRSGIKSHEVVRLGRAWQEVVEVAKERKADLIVLATHGYTGLRHVLLGSVAEKILRHAPCPVLSIRADEDDFS